jgi:hypothetical protein
MKALIRSLWGLLVLAIMAGGCGPSLRVRTDFDRGVNFAKYRTYRLTEGKLVGSAVAMQNTLVKDRIDAALRSELASEGLAQAGQDPDLLVRYAAGARTVRELESVGYPVGPYGGPYGPMYGDVWVEEVPQGMLVIDLVDARTDRLVWRAYCRAEGAGMGSADFIRRAVSRAFDKYPPRVS